MALGTSDALNVYGLLGQAAQAPAAPSNLSAATLSGTSIQLTWTDNSTAPNTATGFDIEQSTDGVNFTVIVQVPPFAGTEAHPELAFAAKSFLSAPETETAETETAELGFSFVSVTVSVAVSPTATSPKFTGVGESVT